MPSDDLLSLFALSLSLSGGSGGGELKEEGSCSDYEAESYFVLSACPYESCFIWPHYRSLLRHLPGHRIQPGKRCERRAMKHMWSENRLWLFPSSLLQTGKEWAARYHGFDLWVSTFHRHHCWKLCGAAAVRPDCLGRAICPQHYCHSGAVKVCTSVSVRVLAFSLFGFVNIK